MSALPAMLAAAAVALGHAIMPDHWLPLAVLGRTQSYPLRRIARLSALAGLAHVLVSVLLGAAIIAIGLQFRASIEHAQNAIVGGLLIATGAAFLILELTGRRHSHEHEQEHGHGNDHDVHDRLHDRDHDPSHRRSLITIMVPFGAAASPDLTILPVFLAAATVGAGVAVGTLIVFAAVTIGTIVALTLFAALGGYQFRGRWLDRWGNSISAAVLIVIGALVLAGVL